MAIKKQAAGYLIVCDGCGVDHVDLTGYKYFDTFMDAIRFKKDARHLFCSVKDVREHDPKKGWSDLCTACRQNADIYEIHRGTF